MSAISAPSAPAAPAAPAVPLLAKPTIQPLVPSAAQPAEPATAQPDAIPIVQTLRPFDVLDVIFHVDATTSREYRVQTGDEIDLSFVTAPELNGKQIVLPDGSIQLPQAGSLSVAGLSLLELRTKIGERYAAILIDPEFHVSLPRAQGGLQVLRETLFHPSFGYSREITVRADGYASFPLVGDISTTGQSIPGLVEALNARYAQIERRVRVDVLLKKSALDQVFVLGEVGVPGAYQIQRPVSPLEVLAMANGAKNTARLDSVVILRRQKNEVIAQVVDLDPALAGTSGAMLYLRPDDLIYVPKTRLASIGDIVRQIGNAVLFNGIGYTFSYRVDDKGTP